MKKINKKSSEKALKQGNIMGINVSVTSMSEVLASVKQKISDSYKLGGRSHKFYIVTPNPELVLMAQKNIQLKEALNAADFAIPDGIGLAQAFKYQSLWAPSNIVLRIPVVLFQGLIVGTATFLKRKWLTDKLNIIHGRKLFMELIKLANENKWKVFFLGGMGGEAEVASRNLQFTNHNLQIQTNKGPKLNNIANPDTEIDRKIQIDVINQINKFKPHLLFVAFGNPKQEIWIHNNISKLDIGGAMAVGGTFRYIAGLSKLPPKWMEKLELEWVWRLITEPFRSKRILNAFPIFPLKVFWYKVKNNF